MSDQNPDTVPPVEGVDPAEVHVIDLSDAMTPPDSPFATLEPDPAEMKRIGQNAAAAMDELAALAGIVPATANVMENQCHAYNKNGQRCEHMAGHPGWHEVSFEWDDESCWVPGTPVAASIAAGWAGAEASHVAHVEAAAARTTEPVTPSAEPVVDHVTKEGTPVVYSTDVPDRLEQPDPNDPCVACEGCRRAHHPGGGKCVRCGTCVRYVG